MSILWEVEVTGGDCSTCGKHTFMNSVCHKFVVLSSNLSGARSVITVLVLVDN